MPDAIVTQGLTKFYGRRKVVDTLDLRVPESDRASGFPRDPVQELGHRTVIDLWRPGERLDPVPFRVGRGNRGSCHRAVAADGQLVARRAVDKLAAEP